MNSTTPFGDPSTSLLDLDLPDQTAMQQDVGRHLRYIDDLPFASVTIEEDHDDELIITQHPVEFGAIISDHAYKKPAEVRIRCAWNNSGSTYPVRGSYSRQEPLVSSGYEGYARAVYEEILALQESRVPFSAVTGKRIYNDMLVASVRVHTAPGSEYTLMADITLREIILVSTKTLSVDAAATRTENATPQINEGKKQATEVNNVGPQIEKAAGADLEQGGLS